MFLLLGSKYSHEERKISNCGICCAFWRKLCALFMKSKCFFPPECFAKNLIVCLPSLIQAQTQERSLTRSYDEKLINISALLLQTSINILTFVTIYNYVNRKKNFSVSSLFSSVGRNLANMPLSFSLQKHGPEFVHSQLYLAFESTRRVAFCSNSYRGSLVIPLCKFQTLKVQWFLQKITFNSILILDRLGLFIVQLTNLFTIRFGETGCHKLIENTPATRDTSFRKENYAGTHLRCWQQTYLENNLKCFMQLKSYSNTSLSITGIFCPHFLRRVSSKYLNYPSYANQISMVIANHLTILLLIFNPGSKTWMGDEILYHDTWKRIQSSLLKIFKRSPFISLKTFAQKTVSEDAEMVELTSQTFYASQKSCLDAILSPLSIKITIRILEAISSLNIAQKSSPDEKFYTPIMCSSLWEKSFESSEHTFLAQRTTSWTFINSRYTPVRQCFGLTTFPLSNSYSTKTFTSLLIVYDLNQTHLKLKGVAKSLVALGRRYGLFTLSAILLQQQVTLVSALLGWCIYVLDRRNHEDEFVNTIFCNHKTWRQKRPLATPVSDQQFFVTLITEITFPNVAEANIFSSDYASFYKFSEVYLSALPEFSTGMSSVGVPIKVLHDAEGHVITLETINGEVFRGKLIEAEDNMNVHMQEIIMTARDGKTSSLQHVYIRGSKIRYTILTGINYPVEILPKTCFHIYLQLYHSVVSWRGIQTHALTMGIMLHVWKENGVQIVIFLEGIAEIWRACKIEGKNKKSQVSLNVNFPRLHSDDHCIKEPLSARNLHNYTRYVGRCEILDNNINLIVLNKSQHNYFRLFVRVLPNPTSDRRCCYFSSDSCVDVLIVMHDESYFVQKLGVLDVLIESATISIFHKSLM
ncbi:Small nuclear ribonucleoprotein Sm D3 [Echinococcus granulosus]|uniref:Small nuclear ribonucleoprotein Sm D3 n=1 Tax=Echinococcus granulosus TaxID=6210 RepID=W6UTS5_ECHGR|nr:Small nuclear ribonucleoprotein Sm D3 [Echinococcus granulosus]EUB64683.1 Small nuclear ribonucleoprotein Sm D3 [Echinococcus granulosus]